MVKVVSLPAYNQITEAMKENKKKVLEETAKFMMDISKLTFGGVILGGIMKQGFDPWSLYGLGASRLSWPLSRVFCCITF